MADEKIMIPVFDGVNYGMWKKRLSFFLKMKDCEKVIERAKITEDVDPWDKNDLKAMNYIYSAISDKQLEFVCEETTAYGIIKKFDSLYLRESTALQIVHRNKLERMRLKDYSDSATFFSDFEKCANDLKSAGAKITEKEKLNYLLNTLPDSYSYIGDLIDTLKEEDQTAEYVKNKIQMAELKNQKDDDFARKSSTFRADRRTCFKCREAGHIQKDCKDGGNSQASNNSGQTSSGRGTWRSSRGRRGAGRGSYGRGRGNCGSQRGGSAHHVSQQHGKKDEEKNSAWVTTVVHHAAQNTETTNVRCNNIQWLVDSGCTDHIINDEKLFEKSIFLNEPVNVYLGDNRVVKATKIGNVKSYFNVFGQNNLIEMKNVFLC